MKERYRIQITDTVTKEKTTFLVNNFNQDVRYQLTPLRLGDREELIKTGFESVSINMFGPKVVQSKKVKTVKKKTKKKTRRKNG